jgi:hypothetical protein
VLPEHLESAVCTLVTIHEPRTPLPVVVALNRDELEGRETLAFGRNFGGEPFRAGKDRLAGGTWAGVHDAGFGVFVLNGEHALGPVPGKRSRGQLVLDLLRTGSVGRAEAALAALSPVDYRPFHLVIASASGVVGASASDDRLDVHAVREGVSMWTAHGPDTIASERQRAHRGRFETLARVWQRTGDVEGMWVALARAMAAPPPPGEAWHAGMCIRSGEGFGTRSSLLVGFASDGSTVVRSADGPPDVTAYRDA